MDRRSILKSLVGIPFIPIEGQKGAIAAQLAPGGRYIFLVDAAVIDAHNFADSMSDMNIKGPVIAVRLGEGQTLDEVVRGYVL